MNVLVPGQDIAVFIGPEGGFDEKEIETALEYGVSPISLGKRILRTETAGLAHAVSDHDEAGGRILKELLQAESAFGMGKDRA